MCGDVESDMTWISCGGGGDVFCLCDGCGEWMWIAVADVDGMRGYVCRWMRRESVPQRTVRCAL